MFDFAPAADCSTEERYAQLLDAARAITDGEPDGVANMANVASLLGEFIPDCNWAGFYRVGPDKNGKDELVLGPFVGRPACIRISFGVGVCGAAAQSGESQMVEDVHAFPGHIACDAASQSEIVVPIIRGGNVIAVIDLDSPTKARFGKGDLTGVEALAELMAERI
ncbi:MAG: GAF domain-containing protein [Erythrobacter sp.]